LATVVVSLTTIYASTTVFNENWICPFTLAVVKGVIIHTTTVIFENLSAIVKCARTASSIDGYKNGSSVSQQKKVFSY
jgi:hypothetical protein